MHYQPNHKEILDDKDFLQWGEELESNSSGMGTSISKAIVKAHF